MKHMKHEWKKVKDGRGVYNSTCVRCGLVIPAHTSNSPGLLGALPAWVLPIGEDEFREILESDCPGPNEQKKDLT